MFTQKDSKAKQSYNMSILIKSSSELAKKRSGSVLHKHTNGTNESWEKQPVSENKPFTGLGEFDYSNLSRVGHTLRMMLNVNLQSGKKE